MPSFDAVSEINHHELTNAVDQTNREISRRFDLKDTAANVKSDDKSLVITANDQFGADQIEKVLQNYIINF